MTYTEVKGNIFNSKAQAIVNTVNCVGVMGKGIALEFRRRYPTMFLAYQKDCNENKLKPGYIYYYPTDDILILNITTTNDWKHPTKMEWIESALNQFTLEYKQRNITSIAMPLLGAERGELDVTTVRQKMSSHLKNLSDIDIEVYDFDPKANDPFFSLLKDICSTESKKELAAMMGIQAVIIEKLIIAVSSGRSQSMSDLTRQKILGDGNMDKLYKYISDYKRNSNSSETKQLTMF